MSDYLIHTEPGEHHALYVSKGDMVTNPLIYLSTNNRTLCMSPTMAEELLKALTAVLHGPFTRAISELALEMELSERARRNTVRAQPVPKSLPPTPTLKPELDQL